MLQQTHNDLSSGGNNGFMLTPNKRIEVFTDFGTYQANRHMAFKSSSAVAEEAPDDGDAPLDDAARGEREYVRQRLREELKREPTEDELDEWLRQHTEGY